MMYFHILNIYISNDKDEIFKAKVARCHQYFSNQIEKMFDAYFYRVKIQIKIP